MPGDTVGPPGEAPPPSGAEGPLTAESEGPSDDEATDPEQGSEEMTAEDEAIDTRPPPPPPAPDPPPPPADGRKMLIAGGIIGSAGLVARLWTTVAGVRAGRNPDPPSPMQVESAGSIIYTPLIATGLGLTGGAMGRWGHTDAHNEMFHQRTPRMKRRLGLGWGLFGGGVAVWAITRLAPARCGSERCAFRTLEVGYYLSLLGTIPGIAIGSYASGFRHYRKRHKHLADLSATPLVARDLRGLSISARF